MIVYSNSCSFGAPQGHPIYPDLVAEEFGAELVNAGVESSCNRRIIRSSVRDLINLKNSSSESILCLIGLSFISRTELWQPTLPATATDGHFHPITHNHKTISWAKGLVETLVKDVHLLVPTKVQDYYKHWLLHMSKEALITDLLTDVIMFRDFCLQNNIDVLIWSNTQLWPGEPEVAIDDVFLKDFTKELDNKNVINPWRFSFQQYAQELGYRPKDADKYGISGHPNEEAHRDFSKFLIKYIKENELV